MYGVPSAPTFSGSFIACLRDSLSESSLNAHASISGEPSEMP